MLRFLAVGLGGFAGAVARYAVSGLVQRYANGSFPVGTLAVNLIGCLLIGALMRLAEERQLFASNTRLFLMIGLLGSFTTFSTFGYETFELLRSHEFLAALCNVSANTLIGVTAVVLGWIGVGVLGV